jgi:hypothetical protein
MATDYGCVLRLLSACLPVNDLPELVLECVADTFDQNTVPPQTLAAWERQFCTTDLSEVDRTTTKLFGKLHGVGDLPAVVWDSGTQEWWKEGKQHRDGDLPALICADGTQEWWKEGKWHRDGGLPAVIYANGTQVWWKEDKRHRDGDLPAVVLADGTQAWYKEGKRHRDGNLPAVIRRRRHHGVVVERRCSCQPPVVTAQAKTPVKCILVYCARR